MDDRFVLGENILLEGHDIAEAGLFTVQVEREVEIAILPDEARRRVNEYVHMEVSTQLYAGAPLLALGAGNSVYWRVPVHLTLPAYGDVGLVGAVEVDPTSGAVHAPPAVKAQLEDNAERLARRFTPAPANAV